MPVIGWVFLLLALAMIVGSLLMLRGSGDMPLSREKMARIKKRQAELEAEEKRRKEEGRW